MNTSHVATLKERLYGANGMGATNFKFHPGTNRDSTAEKMAGSILAGLDTLSEATEITDLSEDDRD